MNTCGFLFCLEDKLKTVISKLPPRTRTQNLLKYIFLTRKAVLCYELKILKKIIQTFLLLYLLSNFYLVLFCFYSGEYILSIHFYLLVNKADKKKY